MKHSARIGILFAAAFGAAARIAGAAEGAAPAAIAAAAPTAAAAHGEAALPGSYGPSEGVASWYGAQFQGRKTANGEVFDKEQLTCAHRSLPFGTLLLVRNLDNGSSVVVRVNDRGPFVKDRIIDLSEAAARLVGMVATGTARVSFSALPPEEVLAWKGGGLEGAAAGPVPGAATRPAPSAAAVPAAAAVWRIQVASYRDEANARATVDRLKAAGLSPVIEAAGAYSRVAFPRLDEAESLRVRARLDVLGYRGYIVTESRER